MIYDLYGRFVPFFSLISENLRKKYVKQAKSALRKLISNGYASIIGSFFVENTLSCIFVTKCKCVSRS